MYRHTYVIYIKNTMQLKNAFIIKIIDNSFIISFFSLSSILYLLVLYYYGCGCYKVKSTKL